MEEKDIEIYLSARKKTFQSKSYDVLVVGSAVVAIILQYLGIIESGDVYVYILAAILIANAILDYGPWSKPTKNDLLNIIEKQINKDPNLIELLAKKNA